MGHPMAVARGSLPTGGGWCQGSMSDRYLATNPEIETKGFEEGPWKLMKKTLETLKKREGRARRAPAKENERHSAVWC